MPLISEPDVSALVPATLLMRGDTLSMPAVSPISSTRGISTGLRYSRCSVVSYCSVLIVRPASSRILLVSGLVQVACCSRFGLIATDHHDSGEVKTETTPRQGS